jgi:hypothetical protein
VVGIDAQGLLATLSALAKLVVIDRRVELPEGKDGAAREVDFGVVYGTSCITGKNPRMLMPALVAIIIDEFAFVQVNAAVHESAPCLQPNPTSQRNLKYRRLLDWVGWNLDVPVRNVDHGQWM